MTHPIIEWTFTPTGASNPDGSLPASFTGTQPAAGPGATALGQLNHALRFGPGAQGRATVSPGLFDPSRFAVQIVFRVTDPVAGRGNLVECTALPFAMFVEPGNAGDRFNLAASVHNGAAGWAGAATWNRADLRVGIWYTASLVYDADTLALMVDDEVVAVTAFPAGGLHAGSGDTLHVGAWVDGSRWPLPGEVAAVHIHHGIPAALDAKLDVERGSPEWHLTRKENEVRPTHNLGPRTADFYFDPATGAWLQPFALGVLSYRETHGVAFLMHGAILAKWRSDEVLRRKLGALVSDELPWRIPGSRRSVFERGSIHWSADTGAVPLLERFHLDYDLLGADVGKIGLPSAPAQSIPGGQVQQFQRGRMYHRAGAPKAFEVHGAILAKYDATGGPGRWGFPRSHESDVKRGTTVVGKLSEFDNCSIYWSPQTPASIVYGAIRDRYLGMEGGPLGHLGFPTTDENDIPSEAGARYNAFQNGSILWFNGPLYVCRPFNVALGRLDTKEEDRDILDLDGQNDLYCRVCLDVNGGRVFDRKFPEGPKHYASANVVQLNLTVPHRVVPNSADLRVDVRVEVWESDDGNLFAGGDDRLGTLTSQLNIANAWGQRPNNGLFTASNFGPWVNRLDWSVKAVQTPDMPLDTFGVQNRGTPEVSPREYAAAFSDVDPDFECDFGLIDSGLKELYYQAVVKGAASGGNCFGMSLETVYTWKGRSRLGLPMRNYADWAPVEDDINVKHIYQLGADAIWWFVGQFLSGNTHDPKGVFQASWDAFNRGENPVACIAQNYDFSGAPHCVLPVAWERRATEWRMTLLDSNFPNQERVLSINPTNNTFRYDGSSDGSRIYQGGAWSGGRLHYMPWSVLNHTQRTPVWDAVMLLLSGTVLLFAQDTDVEALVDESGNNLDGGKATSREALAGKLVPARGFSGAGAIPGRLYLGRATPRAFRPRPEVLADLGRLPHVLDATRPSAPHPTTPGGDVRIPRGLRHRIPLPHSTTTRPTADIPADALAGSRLMEAMRRHGVGALGAGRPTDLDVVNATVRGLRNGKLDGYYKHGMMAVRIRGDVAMREQVNIGYRRMSARDNEISIRSDHERRYDATVSTRLGPGKDQLNITIEGLPASSSDAVRINAQPGLGTIDVIAADTPADLEVRVEGTVGGKPVRSGFTVPNGRGQRLTLANLADPGTLKVAEIDQLNGESRNVRLVPRR